MGFQYAGTFYLRKMSLTERKRWGDLNTRFLFSLPDEIRPLHPTVPIDSFNTRIPISNYIDYFLTEIRNPFSFGSTMALLKIQSYSEEDNVSFICSIGCNRCDFVNFEMKGSFIEDSEQEFLEIFKSAWKLYDADFVSIEGLVKLRNIMEYSRSSAPDFLFGYGLSETWAFAVSPTVIEAFGGRDYLLQIPEVFPGWKVEELPLDGLLIYDGNKPMLETFTLEDILVRVKMMNYLGDQWFDGETMIPESERSLQIRKRYAEHILKNTDVGFVYRAERDNPGFLEKTKEERTNAMEKAKARLAELLPSPTYDTAELKQMEQWAKEHSLIDGDPQDLNRYYHPDIDLVGYYYGEWLRKRLEGEWLIHHSTERELPEWQIRLSSEDGSIPMRLYPIDEVRILMLVDSERSLLKEAESMIRSFGGE